MVEIYNNILNFDELDSTNRYALDLLQKQDLVEFTTIVAKHQTAGRGQRGNSWLVERNQNLTCSIVLRPHHILPAKQFIISQVVSLALYAYISQFSSACSIKWPNDLYVGNKKIAGILIENIIQSTQIKYCVVGIGVNVNQTIFDTSLPNPTSLALLTNKTIDLKSVLHSILQNVNNLYTQIPLQNAKIHSQYMHHLYKWGQPALYEDAEGEFFGKIVHVDETGKVFIEDSHQQMRSYYFKEVQYK